MLLYSITLTLAALLAPRAQPAGSAAPAYLPAAAVQKLTELLPPPVEALTEAEVYLTRAVQEDASAEARARAARAEPGDPLWDFAESMGPAFTKDNCRAIERFITRAQAAGDPINAAVKRKFNRPRPPGSGVESTDSYPSGHCVRAFLRARLLAELAPDHAESLYRRASTMSLNRVIAGKHHPSDAAAGMALGRAIAEAILAEAAANPTSGPATDLAAARAEWERLSR
ncbi:MAG: phosphatase PAP2 family protein [Phycisphaerales bacterium]|nr:phosphatase PAP2 family protein [Phycisphaerales bacterium]